MILTIRKMIKLKDTNTHTQGLGKETMNVLQARYHILVEK